MIACAFSPLAHSLICHFYGIKICGIESNFGVIFNWIAFHIIKSVIQLVTNDLYLYFFPFSNIKCLLSCFAYKVLTEVSRKINVNKLIRVSILVKPYLLLKSRARFSFGSFFGCSCLFLSSLAPGFQSLRPPSLNSCLSWADLLLGHPSWCDAWANVSKLLRVLWIKVVQSIILLWGFKDQYHTSWYSGV